MFGSVGMGMVMVVLDMFVVVRGVRVRVGKFVVAVFVGVRFVVTVLIVRHCRLPVVCDPGRIHSALRDEPWEQVALCELIASCAVRNSRGV